MYINPSATYGVAYWGFVVSAILFGCVIMQGVTYYNTFTKDSTFLKTFVGLMIVLDAVITLCAADAFDFTLITMYGDYDALSYLSNGILGEYILTWVVVTLSQTFYASRVYIVDRKVWYVPATIVALAITAQAAVIVMFVLIYQGERKFSLLQTRKFVIIHSVAGGISSAADITATVAMCYFLASHCTGFRKTKEIVKTLLFYTVNRGVMVATCQMIAFVTFAISPANLWWLPPHVCLSKFHVVTLLALLNSRSKAYTQPDETVLRAISSVRPTTSLTTSLPSPKEFPKVHRCQFSFGAPRTDDRRTSECAIVNDVFDVKPVATLSHTSDAASQDYFPSVKSGEESME